VPSSVAVAVRPRRPTFSFAPRGPTLTLGRRLPTFSVTPGSSRLRFWNRHPMSRLSVGASRRVFNSLSEMPGQIVVGGTAYQPVPLEYSRLDAETALARSREFTELMLRRRSVRHFASDPVPWELVENALRVAGDAPSGANQQPWTFVVVSDPDLKAEVRRAAEHEERLLYEQRAPQAYLDAIEPIGTDWSKPHITDAPYVIAVFEQPYGVEPDGTTKKKHYFVRESVGIAVGFLIAALHAGGLVTLTHSPSPMSFMKKLLDRPENERPFLLIPVGYPAEDAVVPDLEKKPLDDVVVRR
jgi:iodotyrosine deiodinase